MDKLSRFIEEEIGLILRRARKKRGLSISQVAKALDMEAEEVEKIELHSGEVTLAMLQKYATFLDKRIQIRFFGSK